MKKERKKKSTHTAAAQTHVKNFHVFSFENARTCDYTDNFCFFLSLFFPKNFTCIFGCVFLFSQSLLELCSFSLNLIFSKFASFISICLFVLRGKNAHLFPKQKENTRIHSLAVFMYVHTLAYAHSHALLCYFRTIRELNNTKQTRNSRNFDAITPADVIEFRLHFQFI